MRRKGEGVEGKMGEDKHKTGSKIMKRNGVKKKREEESEDKENKFEGKKRTRES